MRLVLSVICVSVMTTAGVFTKMRMKKRVNTLTQLQLFIRLMRPRSEYLHEPFSKTVYDLSENAQLKGLVFLKECSALCKNGTDFPRAWESAVERSVRTSVLKKEDGAMLISFGEAVSSAGAFDITGVLTVYEKNFGQLLLEAREKLDGDGKICVSVFLFVGLLLGIIII